MDYVALSAWANVGISIGTLGLAWAAIRAVNAWKAELKGKDEYALSKAIQLGVYDCQAYTSMIMEDLENDYAWKKLHPVVVELNQLLAEGCIHWDDEFKKLATDWAATVDEFAQFRQTGNIASDLSSRLNLRGVALAKYLLPYMRKAGLREQLEQKYQDATSRGTSKVN